MRRADLVVLVLVLAFGAFIGMQVLGVRQSAPPQPVAADTGAVAAAASDKEVVVSTGALAAPARDVEGIRQKLRANERGTFIGEILAARDSNISRWPERLDNPVPVWIDERSPLAGPEQQLATSVRRAFANWGLAGVPLAFTFVGDSSRAEVKVTFVDHFDRGMSGQTLWMRDANSWIRGGDIQLSLRSGSGQLLNSDQLYAIALHEVGHLLGLDHTKNASAIMAARVQALALTEQDIATMKLIYQVMPGSIGGRQ